MHFYDSVHISLGFSRRVRVRHVLCTFLVLRIVRTHSKHIKCCEFRTRNVFGTYALGRCRGLPILGRRLSCGSNKLCRGLPISK